MAIALRRCSCSLCSSQRTLRDPRLEAGRARTPNGVGAGCCRCGGIDPPGRSLKTEQQKSAATALRWCSWRPGLRGDWRAHEGRSESVAPSSQ
jgi:hypothetical protein